MTTILKLGGSVITRKGEPETLDQPALDRVVEAVAAHPTDDLVVVHGGGSFGHHHAARHGVSNTDGTGEARALSEIHTAMTDLNEAVVETFHRNGVDTLPVRPLSVARRDESGALSLPGEPVATMLGEAFVPVLHGDVITHEGKGGTVLSGDEIVVSLARTLDADRVGLCSTVPGVLDEDGTVVPEIDSFEAVADALGDSEATDVTGGMAGKVRSLLTLDASASIFDPDGLPAFLRGGSVGTVIRGDRQR